MRENQLDITYQNLVKDIIKNGRDKTDRTGTGTVSVFSRDIRHDMSDGFPLLTTKKMSLKNIKAELFWFLRGDTNIKFLVERGCNIWNGDAYKNYVKKHKVNGSPYLTQKEFVAMIKSDDEFAEHWGELGPIYGKQWRDWGGIDQVADLVEKLIKNPDSRRLIVNAWNVGELKRMVLPPCHFGFECYTEELTWEERRDLLSKEDRDGHIDENGYYTGFGHISPFTEKFIHLWLDRKKIPKRRLSLKWHQRSVDTGLGLPYNIASYGLLLLMLADEVNMVPGELVGTLTNVHLYKDHLEAIQEQLDRKPFPLPKVFVRDGIMSHCDGGDIVMENYESHPSIRLPLSN